MLENNLKAIERYNKTLAEKIFNHQIVGHFEFVYTDSQDVNIVYEKLPIHDSLDPQKEALDNFNNLQDKTASTIHILYGLGLGYVLKRFFISSPGKIIVYEPNLDFLRLTLENVDFNQELNDPRVIFCHTEEDLELAINNFYMFEDPINISYLKSYALVFMDKIQQLADKVKEIKAYSDNDTHTLFSLGKLWVDESFVNMKDVLNSQYLGCLKDKFKGVPAVITSAGPSLNKNVDKLKQYEKNVLIITVGAALRVIKEVNNITPDMVAFCDTHRNTENQLKEVKSLELMNLLIQPTAFRGVWKRPFKRKFCFLADNLGVAIWLSKTLNIEIENFTNFASVSTASLFAAYNLGCNPIIFLGQDLALSESGNSYADDKLIDNRHRHKILKVPAWDSGLVSTLSTYATQIKDFKTVADSLSSDVRLINATEGGAYIDGLEHMTFDEAAKFIPDKKVDVDAIINEAESLYKNPFSISRQKVVSSLKTHSMALTKLQKQISKAQISAKKVNAELIKPQVNKVILDKLFDELLDANNKINRSLHKECPLLINYIQKEMYYYEKQYKRFERSKSIEGIKTYVILYSNLYKAMLEHIPHIKSKITISLKDIAEME